jgi:hypothetical protein
MSAPRWKAVSIGGHYRIALVDADGDYLEVRPTRYGTIAVAKNAAKHENERMRAEAAAGPTEAEIAAVGEIIWRTSREDEGTISVTGANIVAKALLAAFTITPKENTP